MRSKLNPKNYNFRYIVTLSKYNFIKVGKIKSRNININNENIVFSTNKKGLNKIYEKINIDEIEVIDSKKKLLNLVFIKHLPLTLSLIIMITMFLISGKYVREISFENDSDYNYEIYNTVANHLVKKGLFYELDINLNDLNRNLRNTYQQYAYIGVKKSGSKLIIELTNYNSPIVDNSNNKTFGDIIAKYDSYIVGVESKKGVVLVTTSQSVKKDDILISGNLNYKINPSNLEKLVKPDGIILGEVNEYFNLKVEKEKKTYSYKMVKKYYEISFFNRFILNKKKENDFYKKEDVFNLFNIFSLSKINLYSLVESNIIYDDSDALKYAKSLVYYEFNLSKVSSKEKIKEIDVLKVHEDDYQYEYTFLVKSIRNIGYFKPYEKG